jgi:hypothetical protein
MRDRAQIDLADAKGRGRARALSRACHRVALEYARPDVAMYHPVARPDRRATVDRGFFHALTAAGSA